jgi:rRNA-processing protein FCF1
MLDTNVLHYIYDNDLSWQIDWFIRNRPVGLYITYVQLAEAKGIISLSSDSIMRKCSLVQTILAIGVGLIPTSSGIVGTDKESRRGYKGSQVGTFKIISDHIAEELTKHQGSKDSNPIGKNTADLIILQTAIDENMDYIVTDDRNMKNLLLKLSHAKLKALDNNDLVSCLNSLP